MFKTSKLCYQLPIQLSEEQKAWVEAEATRRLISKSSVVRHAVQKAMEAHKLNRQLNSSFETAALEARAR